MNNNTVTQKIIEILKFIPAGKTLETKDNNTILSLSDGRTLLRISSSHIEIPKIPSANHLFDNRSPLQDEFVPTDQIKKLLGYLLSHNLFQRLNHVGICYQTKSVKDEKERILQEARNAQVHVYEENSNDGQTWLFVGDIANWDDPLVEIVLVQNTDDKWKDYWLPHFQIDIDTFLNGDEIEALLLKIFEGKVKPYRLFETDKFICVVRARLGILSGINI
ncbi:MAG: hypothetical protein NUV98_06215, partial [Candidatus Roizmanbacteria bacterium]|nr:hypothetical protein [Candidatus Roizmanbacteria bacterium]